MSCGVIGKLGVFRSGWAFPWGLRVQLAQAVLKGLFDSNGYVPQYDVLLKGISSKLWPVLGITATVADALWAWVHFCEVSHHFSLAHSFRTYHHYAARRACCGRVTC